MNGQHRQTYHRQTFPALTPARLHRLALGVTLQEAALRAKISTRRASEIERDITLAREGELEALAKGVETIAAERRENSLSEKVP